MAQYSTKNKSFSFSADGSLNQCGLREIIQSISPKILRPAVKYTLLVASEHATASDRLCIFKSLQTIADECGISKDTARRHLHALTHMGILNRKIMIDKETGKQRPCLYTYSALFVRIAKAFRRIADMQKSRRSDLYKAALSKFNALLSALISRARPASSGAEDVGETADTPLQSATLPPSQNQPQYSRSFDPVDKKEKAIIEVSKDKTISGPKSSPGGKGPVGFMEDMRAVLASAISSKRAACKNAERQAKASSRSNSVFPAGTSPRKAPETTTFQHGIYEAANREEEARHAERQRAAASMTLEQTQARISGLRALLKRNTPPQQKAGA